MAAAATTTTVKEDPTKIDCHCGHVDCDAILRKKSTGKGVMAQEEGDEEARGLQGELPRGKTVRRVFFSPHPDDVAYSCFGLVSMSSKQASAFDEERAASPSGSASSATSRRESSSSVASCSSSSSCCSQDDSKGDGGRRPEQMKRRPSTAPSAASDEQWQDSVIVTVFSKSRCANGAIGVSLGHCVDQTTQMRQREDETFAKSVGARLVSLGFSDTSARDEGSRRPDLLLSASPRMSTFTLSVDHPAFERVKKRVKPIVEWAVQSNATIYIPLAVGCHIDHWMTRTAVLSTLIELEHTSHWDRLRAARTEMRLSGIDPMHVLRLAEQPSTAAAAAAAAAQQGSHLVFYEDLPYGFIGTDDMVRQTVSNFLPRNVQTQLVPLTDADWARKMEAVKRYASQMKSTLIDMLHDHALLLAKRGPQLDLAWLDAPPHWTMAERSWVLEDVCGLTANLVASMTSASLDERGAPQRKRSPSAIRTKPLPVTFTSPFAPTRADVLLPPVDVVDSFESPKQKTVALPPAAATDVTTRRKSHTPGRRLRRMSTCPPSAFPIPFHHPTTPSTGQT